MSDHKPSGTPSSRRQPSLVIAALGLLVVAFIVLRPPWKADVDYAELRGSWSAEHHWIWDPPYAGYYAPGRLGSVAASRIDGSRLLLEVGVVLLITAALVAMVNAGAADGLSTLFKRIWMVLNKPL